MKEVWVRRRHGDRLERATDERKGRACDHTLFSVGTLPAAQVRKKLRVVAEESTRLSAMVGNLLDHPDGPINEVDPATISIGERVRVVFRPAASDVALPSWVRDA